MTPNKINSYLFFQLPAAWWCGVRVKKLEANSCQTTVKYRWINQNPFRSMYFAVQLMAAELSTGALVMQKIRQSQTPFSMLVAQQNSVYHKKITGRVFFSCQEGHVIDQVIQKAIQTGEGQVFSLKSIGTNAMGELLTETEFIWTVKVKKTVTTS